MISNNEETIVQPPSISPSRIFMVIATYRIVFISRF